MTKLTSKKLLVAIIVCAVLVGGSVMWFTRQTVEAAVLDPHPGLVGWWRFDEGSGTVAGDSSGNGNNGAISGATWTTGKFGNASSFDGVNNYAAVPDSAILRPQFESGVAWIKLDSISQQTILSKPYHYRFHILGGGQLRITIWDDTGTPTVLTGTTVLPVGIWCHAAWTYDGTTLTLYINGEYEASTAKVGVLDTNAGSNMQIGAWVTTNDLFNGIIDEVRIYNRTLSATEIQADFQQSPDFSSNLLAKVPKGTTQVITTILWQGTGSINATIMSPSQTYTEDMVPVYQKTAYSTSGDTSRMLNMKRLSISVTALSADQNWNVTLTFDNIDDYQMTVEVQK